MFIPRGQSLALVGANGAGKTTFIKLLANLYQPTEGRVLLDGRDLRDWEPEALRARIGVIFQDFNQYQLVLRENVGFGSVDAPATIRPAWGAPSSRAAPPSWSPDCPRAPRRSSAAGSRAASSCPAASGRRSPSRAPSCARRPTS